MVRYKDVADQLAAAPAPAVDADAALGVGSVAVVCAEFKDDDYLHQFVAFVSGVLQILFINIYK